MKGEKEKKRGNERSSRTDGGATISLSRSLSISISFFLLVFPLQTHLSPLLEEQLEEGRGKGLAARYFFFLVQDMVLISTCVTLLFKSYVATMSFNPQTKQKKKKSFLTGQDLAVRG